MRLILLLALLATIAGTEVRAQQIILPCVPSGSSCIPVSAANPLPTTGNTVTSVTIGTTTLTSGTDKNVLFQDGASPTGVLQENSAFTFTKATGTLATTILAATGAITGATVAAGGCAIGGNVLCATGSTALAGSVSTTGASAGYVFIDRSTAASWQWYASGGLAALFQGGNLLTVAVTSGNLTVVGNISATLGAASGTSTVCNTAGTSTALTLVASGTACAASAMRFKDAYPPEALNLAGLAELRTDQTWSYRKDSGIYENGKVHVGLFADDVEAMDPRCVVYDQEGKLLNYYDRCVIAYLVAARNADRAEFEAYKRSHP